MKSRSTFYSTGIPTTFNDLGECDEIDRGGVPCAVPFCGYGTADFGIIPDRMKEDGNQIIVYQPEGELEKGLIVRTDPEHPNSPHQEYELA